jgi:hypothetical protein
MRCHSGRHCNIQQYNRHAVQLHGPTKGDVEGDEDDVDDNKRHYCANSKARFRRNPPKPQILLPIKSQVTRNLDSGRIACKMPGFEPCRLGKLVTKGVSSPRKLFPNAWRACCILSASPGETSLTVRSPVRRVNPENTSYGLYHDRESGACGGVATATRL